MIKLTLALAFTILSVGCAASSEEEEAGVSASELASRPRVPGEIRLASPARCADVRFVANPSAGSAAVTPGYGTVLVACGPDGGGPSSAPAFVNPKSGAPDWWEPLPKRAVTTAALGGFTFDLPRLDEVVAAPSDPSVVYGVVRGYPAPLDPRTEGLFVLRDGRWRQIVSPPGGPLDQLDVSPSSPSHLVGMNARGLWRSSRPVRDGEDPGWEIVDAAPSTPSYAWNLVRGVSDRRTIYTVWHTFSHEGVEGTVVRRTVDDGVTWTTVASTADRLDNFVVDPTDAAHLYYTSPRGFFSTRNGGDEVWVSNEGLPQVPGISALEYEVGVPLLDRVSVKPTGEGANPYQLLVWAREVRPQTYAEYLAGVGKAGLYRWDAERVRWRRVADAPTYLSSASPMTIVNSAKSPSLLLVQAPGDGGGGNALLRALLR